MKCIYCENNGRCKIQETFTKEEIGCTSAHLLYKYEQDIDLFQIILKYLITDGQSLRFKNISFKKNKKDFERILKRLKNED